MMTATKNGAAGHALDERHALHASHGDDLLNAIREGGPDGLKANGLRR